MFTDRSSLTFSRCTTEEYEQMLCFLDKSFNKPGSRWFETYHGHIFQAHAPYVGTTFLVKEKKRLVGTIGIYPLTLRIGESLLTVGGIGSVSTDPSARGKGIMSLMLRKMLAIMNEQRFDLSWLSGDRFRYRNYGWDLGGRRIVFHVKLRDVLRYHPKLPIINVRSADDANMKICHQHYAKFSSRIERNAQAWRDLKRRKDRVPVSGAGQDGSAYLYYSGEMPNRIIEMQGKPLVAMALLARHMKMHSLERVDINYPCSGDTMAQALHYVATNYSIQHKGQIQVLNVQSTWEKLLPEVKRRFADAPRQDLRALSGISSVKDRKVLLDRLLGFFDNIPVLPRRLAKFEFLRPLGWWMSEYDEV